MFGVLGVVGVDGLLFFCLLLLRFCCCCSYCLLFFLKFHYRCLICVFFMLCVCVFSRFAIFAVLVIVPVPVVFVAVAVVVAGVVVVAVAAAAVVVVAAAVVVVVVVPVAVFVAVAAVVVGCFCCCYLVSTYSLFLVPTAAQNLASRLHHCVDFIFYFESHQLRKHETLIISITCRIFLQDNHWDIILIIHNLLIEIFFGLNDIPMIFIWEIKGIFMGLSLP